MTTKTLSQPKAFDSERLVHGIKTAMACLLGYAITKTAHFPVDQWLVITIIVVMCAQVNVGSMLHKSYMRLVGTSAGSVLAALTLEMFGTNEIAIATMLGLSGIVFSYAATSDTDYSDAGTLGAVTVAIVLIAKHPTVTTAADRFFEISIAILIAAFVSQFIMPIHARSNLRHMQAKTIGKLRDFYVATIMTDPNDKVIAGYRELDEEIVKSLSTQRSLAKQSAHEPFGKAFNIQHFSSLLRCEKEMFRSIVCMNYAYTMLGSHRHILADMPGIKEFHESVCKALDTISPCVEHHNLCQSDITIPDIQSVKDAVHQASQLITGDDLIYIDGFLFCADLLAIHIKELSFLVSKDSKNTES